MSNETKITCPNCGQEIDVNSVITHNLEEEFKKKYNAKWLEEKKKYQEELDKLDKQKKEIEEKYPDLVWTDKYGYKNLQYELLVSVGISALIENQKRVEVLNNFLKDLSTKIGG